MTYTGLRPAMDHAIRAAIGNIVNIDVPPLPPKPDPPVIPSEPDVCDELELLVNEKLLHDVVFCTEDK